VVVLARESIPTGKYSRYRSWVVETVPVRELQLQPRTHIQLNVKGYGPAVLGALLLYPFAGILGYFPI